MSHYSATNYSHIKHNPDRIYYDLTITNNGSPDVAEEIPLRFDEVRGIPIINSASDYNLSIIRFQMSTFTTSLPILFFQVQHDQGDRNLGVYSVTLSYNDNINPVVDTQPEYIEWIPQEKDALIPKPPSLNENKFQEFTNYYYVYNFQYMIQLINTSLSNAMDKLRFLVAPALDNIDAPFLTFEDGQLVIIYAMATKFDTNAFPRVEIFMNRFLFSLLSSLPTIKHGFSNPNNKYYQFIMDKYKGLKVCRDPDNSMNDLIFSKMEYSTVSSFSPVSSIIFTSNTLPITPNAISAPRIFRNGNPVQLSKSSNNFSNIITDISSLDIGYKGGLLYNPTAQYRYIDLNNDAPIHQIDINVFWLDHNGLMHQFMLAPGGTTSMKLLFEKKIKNEVIKTVL